MRPRTLLLTAGLLLLPGLAYAGPPWISLELPANPQNAATRGAFFVVHTYHHGTPTEFPLTGSAEGLVQGKRQTIPLEIRPTGAPGVFAVRASPLPAGAWVMVFHLGDPGSPNGAGMLVTLDGQRQVNGVTVPSRSVEGGRWVVPRGVTAAEVEAALRRQMAAGKPGPDHRLVAGIGLLLGLPLLGALRRR